MSVFGVRKEFLDVNTPKTSISASAAFIYITIIYYVVIYIKILRSFVLVLWMQRQCPVNFASLKEADRSPDRSLGKVNK